MAGWSLIELLVASALGASLAGFALRAYLAGSLLRTEVNAEAHLHEGARYALHVLARNAKLAGFPGCLGETAEFAPLDSGWTGPISFNPVEGWNDQRPHPELGATPGRDVVAFWWSVAGCGAGGARELRPPSASPGVSAGLRGNLFYIGRRGNSPDNPPALFMREISNFGESSPARELVEGLRSMRVLYRVAGASAPVAADQVTAWENLREIRIELRMRSPLVPGFDRDFTQSLGLRNRRVDVVDFP